MKLIQLVEMPLRAGEMDAQATEYVQPHRQAWAQAPHVGDIESMRVKKLKDVYSVWDGDELVVTAKAEPTKDARVIDDVWVNPKYRNQRHFTKLLLFFKTREGMNKMILGSVHSTDTHELLKAGGLKLFAKSWQNRRGEVKPFSPDTIDEFYGPGQWQLVIENHDSDSFADWPRFYDPARGYIKESFDILIDVFNMNEAK